MTYEPQAQNKRHHHPDLDMELDLYVHDVGDVNIFHNKPFEKALSWLEYDTTTSKIDFIMEDGDIRNFGFPIDPKFKAYLQNTQFISVVRFHGDIPVDELQLPLITHGG